MILWPAAVLQNWDVCVLFLKWFVMRTQTMNNGKRQQLRNDRQTSPTLFLLFIVHTQDIVTENLFMQ